MQGARTSPSCRRSWTSPAINRISRTIYANAAGAIAGMVSAERPESGEERPLVTASMFGNTTTAVGHAQGIVEAAGYEVLVFHATGTGGAHHGGPDR